MHEVLHYGVYRALQIIIIPAQHDHLESGILIIIKLTWIEGWSNRHVQYKSHDLLTVVVYSTHQFTVDSAQNASSNGLHLAVSLETVLLCVAQQDFQT